MKTKIFICASACSLAMIATGASQAFAYSIYPNSAPSAPTTGGASTQSFDFDSAWNQLTTPFANFFTSLENVAPSDLPNQPPAANPSTQLQSVVPENSGAQKILTGVVNFLSWITGWLIVLADQLGQWIASAIH